MNAEWWEEEGGGLCAQRVVGPSEIAGLQARLRQCAPENMREYSQVMQEVDVERNPPIGGGECGETQSQDDLFGDLPWLDDIDVDELARGLRDKEMGEEMDLVQQQFPDIPPPTTTTTGGVDGNVNCDDLCNDIMRNLDASSSSRSAAVTFNSAPQQQHQQQQVESVTYRLFDHLYIDSGRSDIFHGKNITAGDSCYIMSSPGHARLYFNIRRLRENGATCWRNIDLPNRGAYITGVEGVHSNIFPDLFNRKQVTDRPSEFAILFTLVRDRGHSAAEIQLAGPECTTICDVYGIRRHTGHDDAPIGLEGPKDGDLVLLHQHGIPLHDPRLFGGHLVSYVAPLGCAFIWQQIGKRLYLIAQGRREILQVNNVVAATHNCMCYVSGTRWGKGVWVYVDRQGGIHGIMLDELLVSSPPPPGPPSSSSSSSNYPMATIGGGVKSVTFVCGDIMEKGVDLLGPPMGLRYLHRREELLVQCAECLYIFAVEGGSPCSHGSGGGGGHEVTLDLQIVIPVKESPKRVSLYSLVTYVAR